MSDVVIRAEGLGKRYLIGHQSAERESYTALRDVVGRTLKGLGRSALDMMRGNQIISGDELEEFWALKNVNFEIKRGEVVGIIGRNGAGKSTLLKILSRITEPSAGRVEIKGRVASLLEVGTGFHPELTGRENIFLNGAILGMTQSEIRRKFDEIVAFAEVEKFLDTPVKRYSSGMYVRLAFAVAAHLEPEILVVDEVLAVGDAEFQRKCLGKIQDVAGHGRTVLFVSHNMAAVHALCGRGLLLEHGDITVDDNAQRAIATHLRAKLAPAEDVTPSFHGSSQSPRITRMSLESKVIEYGEIARLRLEIASPRSCKAAIEVELHDHTGCAIAYTSTSPMFAELIDVREGVTTNTELSVGPLLLARGSYSFHLWLIQPWSESYHVVSEPLAFEVTKSDPGHSGFDFAQSYARGCFALPVTQKSEILGQTKQTRT